MYLLGREKAPDHAAIARFRSQRLTEVVDELFAQLVRLLVDAGELSLSSVFIDATKLEANANRYSFVWKKSTQTNEEKMRQGAAQTAAAAGGGEARRLSWPVRNNTSTTTTASGDETVFPRRTGTRCSCG